MASSPFCYYYKLFWLFLSSRVAGVLLLVVSFFFSFSQMKNGWDKTPKHQLCCCCCTWKSICCIWETFRLAVLSVTSFSLLLSPNGFKKLGQWKSQRGTTSRFGHTTIYKVFFFFRHKTFLPLFFLLHSAFVCVYSRPVSVYSDGKRCLSFATLVWLMPVVTRNGLFSQPDWESFSFPFRGVDVQMGPVISFKKHPNDAPSCNSSSY